MRFPTDTKACIGVLIVAGWPGILHGQWQSLGGGVTNEVRSFCELPGEDLLLIGGAFPWLNADSVRVNNIAAWDGSAWSTEHTGGGNGSNWTYGNTDPVTSLVNWHDTLYVSYFGVPWHDDPDIAFGTYLVNDTWHALPARPNGPVLFAAVNGRLFMGGSNTTLLDSVPFPGLCEVVSGHFSPLQGIPFQPYANIWAYEHWHGAYYFGGQINSLPLGSPNIVSFDGVDQWLPLAQGIGGNHIRSIRGYGDSLYVGGYFMPGANVQSKHIQIWDGAVWHPFFPQVEFISQVFDMEVYEGALWICGNFRFSPDGPVYAILRYDGHHLCAIGGPCPSGDNNGIAFFQNELYMAVGYSFPDIEFERVARLPLEGLLPDECVEVVTGLGERNPAHEHLILSPNPAEDFITFRSGGSSASSNVIVRDELGRQVTVTVSTQEGMARVDIQELAPGCYSVEVLNDAEKSIGKFIKR